MQIPDKIKILWKEYEIQRKSRDDDLISDGDALYGRVYIDKKRIVLNTEYDNEQQKCTLIHECVHALDDMYGINLSEEQVRQLGNALYTLAKDNPQLF